MRIEGFNPLLPTAKLKEERKRSSSTPAASQDQFLKTAETAATYSAPPVNKDHQLQVKNYVTTVLYRQNWAEKTSRFNSQYSRSSIGMGPQTSGYWKPEQVAKRIVSFSKAFGDNTGEKIDQLKETALQSLDATAEMLGGSNATLQKTYDAIVNEFDQWKNETSAL